MGRWNAALLFLAALAALVFGAPAPAGPPETASLAPEAALETSENLDGIVERLAPLVVAIHVERLEDLPGPQINERRLNGLNDEDKKDLTDYYQRPPGPATGLLLDRQGNVLTTLYNVSKVVQRIRIALADGRELPARIASRSAADDLVLLRSESPIPEDFPVAELSWSDPSALRIGKFVIALGCSPEPERVTATLGIVSAVSRNHHRLLQTDAALNYGNVGGPMVDLDGNVVGLAAFVGHVYPDWGFNSGIGFGVRADRIRDILPGMIEGKDVPAPEQPFLGVGPAGDPDDPGSAGARVGQVVPDSAAARAGLERGDIIVEFGGAAVEDFTQLRTLIFQRRPGEEVKAKVRRGDETLELTFALGKRAES
jgi:S1-C subfamily serine protease